MVPPNRQICVHQSVSMRLSSFLQPIDICPPVPALELGHQHAQGLQMFLCALAQQGEVQAREMVERPVLKPTAEHGIRVLHIRPKIFSPPPRRDGSSAAPALYTC